MKFAIAMLTIILAGFCLTPANGQSSTNTSGWKSVKVCGLTFRVPEAVEDLKRRGLDSCMAAFQGERFGISLDHGVYSAKISRSEDYEDFKIEAVEINGRSGKIAVYKNRKLTADDGDRFSAQLYVVVRRLNGPWKAEALSMRITFSDAKDIPTAKAILRSVRFVN